MSSKYVVVVRQRETKRDKSVGCKEKGEIKSDEDRVILRDEKNASQGEDKTERKKEREGKQKREKQAPETKPLFGCSDLFERLFPFFLTPSSLCVRE